ncbi:hypothetical protein VP193E371_P0241 [Vibrio phage 193E37-1]|nr:hypothetical protein VP193E371_P0241 [Vibrio phage 193E37-1]
MRLLCKHEYKVVNQHVDYHHLSTNEYTALVSCSRCGKTKYITNKDATPYAILFVVVLGMIGTYSLLDKII